MNKYNVDSFIHAYTCPTNKSYQFDIKHDDKGKSFENMTNLIITRTIDAFNENLEKIICDELYKLYKEQNINIYIISRSKFKHFIETMLPIYLDDEIREQFMKQVMKFSKNKEK